MATTNRSFLREFLASIATIRGDLSNITAPPFLLATQSTTQFPSYWAEFADYFTAPAKEGDALLRSVLVLKWFLVCLKRQQYAGQVCWILLMGKRDHCLFYGFGLKRLTIDSTDA